MTFAAPSTASFGGSSASQELVEAATPHSDRGRKAASETSAARVISVTPAVRSAKGDFADLVKEQPPPPPVDTMESQGTLGSFDMVDMPEDARAELEKTIRQAVAEATPVIKESDELAKSRSASPPTPP